MNKNYSITAGVALLITLCVMPSARAETTSPQKIRVLIVDGFSNHDWKLTTQLIRGILEPTGLFDVAVSTSPPKADSPGWDDWRPKFADYDVVIQNCNDYGGGPSWPSQVQRDFEDFVLKGGGVLAHHSANNAFPNWPAYNDMIGLLWRKKDQGTALSIDENEKIVSIPSGEGENTGHGPRNDVLVHCLGEHPIHAGLPKGWLTPQLEVYYYTRGPAKNVDVLSYSYDPKTKMNWPVEWTVTYGQGRIYSSTFGHVWKGDVQPKSMRCADEQILLQRAIQWLARRPITVPVPADFPTSEATSIRAEIPLSRAAEAPLHVAFMIGEDEYKTWDTLPAFAKEQLEPRGVKCTIIQADQADPNHFPGLEVIDNADELVLSVRRRPLPADDMARLKQFFDKGKGLVAIRTACHAFAGHGAKPQVQKISSNGPILTLRSLASITSAISPIAKAPKSPGRRMLRRIRFWMASQVPRFTVAERSTDSRT
jgi:Trehalose utilisation